MKRLVLLVLLVPALALAYYDTNWFDLNHWKSPVENYGRWGFDWTSGGGGPGGSWPQPLKNFYVFGAGPWFGAIVPSPSPETLCTYMYDKDSSGTEMCPTLCRHWRGGTRDSLDRVYKYPGVWPPPASRFPMAPQSPRSDMDMWCCFCDSNPDNHRPPGRPLGIDVYLTVHGFADSLAQDFFFLKYELANCLGESIQQAYFGMMLDVDIGNHADDMTGLILDRLLQVGPDTIRVKNTGYAYDYDTVEVAGRTWESGTPGIVAVMVIGTPDSLGLTAFKKFTWGADTMNDADQYLSLAGYSYKTGTYEPYDSIDASPGDKQVLLASGPFGLAPDSVLTFWYVVIASPCDLSELALRCRWARYYFEQLTGVAEKTPTAVRRTPNFGPTVVRGVLLLPRDMTELPGNSDRVPRPVLLDISGRKVMDLLPGANDVSRLSPGVYFVRDAQAQAQAQATHKVVVAR
jgi:hypothetical protein